MPKPINHDLTTLAPGERLWLARVFGQGVSQDLMAPKAKISHNHYVSIELGRLPLTPLLKGLLNARIPPLQQRLRLARRRSRRHLRPLAKAVGVSHVTLLKMEREANQKLVRFWCGQGFVF